MINSSLLKAYRRTDYRVACCVIHIGRRTAAIDRLLIVHHAREAALITAYNPFSRRRPLGWNRRMQARLAQAARRHPALPAEAALITAYNPFSRRRPLGWNRRMQARLAQAARRHPALPAEGTWRRWSEDHLLLFANHRLVLCLARQFQQHAIVSMRIRQPAHVLFTYQ